MRKFLAYFTIRSSATERLATLFLLFRETTIDLWKKKLDWVASQGGMALVNVHPDYMAFEGKPTSSEYQAGLYEELLKHVVTRYGDTCWHALPREIAAFAAQIRPRVFQDPVTSAHRLGEECAT